MSMRERRADSGVAMDDVPLARQKDTGMSEARIS